MIQQDINQFALLWYTALVDLMSDIPHARVMVVVQISSQNNLLNTLLFLKMDLLNMHALIMV
jgi:hypothetical protein